MDTEDVSRRWYAGLDASGTPELRQQDNRQSPYVVALAAHHDPEQFARVLEALRPRFGMRRNDEFHAQRISGAMRQAVLEAAMRQNSEWPR